MYMGEMAGQRATEANDLTMAPTREKGHPVDGDGHSTMFIVEVVDVVGGAERGGDPGRHSWAGKHQ